MKDKISTWYKLGFNNIVTVASYRILKKLGYYRFVLPIKTLVDESFFSDSARVDRKKLKISYFSFHSVAVSSPPNWFLNPWNKVEAPMHKSGKKGGDVLSNSSQTHWSDIPDFIPELGDIKLVWELSRFDWLSKMAWAYKQGDQKALPTLELWLRDWVKQNPVNSGVNWKCGQETSLRCLNLLASSLMIDKAFENPKKGFLSLLEAHLDRITPTLRYAMAQDNNHGTSEASALFVVGEYFKHYGTKPLKKKGRKWSQKGRYWLENRIKKLVMNDGSFSQHSIIYHRLFLDTLSFTDLLRERLNVSEFSPHFYSMMKKAVHWLHSLTDDISGNGPNLGANDGAFLFNLNDNNYYRDFRPSIQLGAITFHKKKINDASETQHPMLSMFNKESKNYPQYNNRQPSFLFADGGYAQLRKTKGFAVVRLPIFKFRPSHADVHHLDIWHNGVNLIRDGGTYSYNTSKELLEYFSGTKAHSTIQFDDRDQMPRLGRFLFGNWISPDELYLDKVKKMISSSYTDAQNGYHKRTIENILEGWKITDEFKGFTSKAVLRWRLVLDNWVLKDQRLSGIHFDIKVKSTLNISLKLTEDEESLYYMEKQKIPVLEVSCNKPGLIETMIIIQ